MQERLQILITAENKQAIAAMKQTVNEMNGVSVAAEKNGAAVKANMTNYQNLGRVIQDLPYGFNGVANNLTQLIPSVGALGLAFSGVVTAITFAQVGFGSWTRGLGGATAETKAAEEENKKYTESLAQETTQLNILYKTVTNANQPMVIRIEAVKELRDLYGGYLKNFSDEEILAGKAATAYRELTNAILMKARANAAQAKIEKIVAKQLEAEINLAEQTAKALDKTNKSKVELAAGGAIAGPAGLGLFLTGVSDLYFGTKGIIDAGNAAGELNKEIADYQIQLDRLYATIQANQVAPFTAERGRGAAAAAAPRVQTETPHRQLSQGLTVMPEQYDAATAAVTKFSGSLGFLNIVTAQQLQNQDALIERQAYMTETMNQYNELAQMGASAFSQLANSLLNGEDFGKAFANVLLNMAVQLGAVIVQAQILAALIKSNPALEGLLATTGGISKIIGGIGGAFSAGNTVIRGNDIVLATQRSNVGLGRRRGR